MNPCSSGVSLMAETGPVCCRKTWWQVPSSCLGVQRLTAPLSNPDTAKMASEWQSKLYTADILDSSEGDVARAKGVKALSRLPSRLIIWRSPSRLIKWISPSRLTNWTSISMSFGLSSEGPGVAIGSPSSPRTGSDLLGCSSFSQYDAKIPACQWYTTRENEGWVINWLFLNTKCALATTPSQRRYSLLLPWWQSRPGHDVVLVWAMFSRS